MIFYSSLRDQFLHSDTLKKVKGNNWFKIELYFLMSRFSVMVQGNFRTFVKESTFYFKYNKKVVQSFEMSMSCRGGESMSEGQERRV